MFTETTLIEVLTEVKPVIVSRFASKLATLGARVDVEDLMQDVSIKAFTSFDGCQAETVEQLRHWILTIARNTCEGLITTHRGYAKRSTRMEAMSIDNKASSDDTSFQPAVSDDPADIVAIDETIAEVMAALGTLSERQQIAVRMKYMDGAEYDAIAAALNVSYGAARTLVSRGVENLRSVAAK